MTELGRGNLVPVVPAAAGNTRLCSYLARSRGWRPCPPTISSSDAPVNASGGGGRQHEILERLAQRRFENLASGRVRDFGDEGDVVGHPPLGDLAVEK
jgi:hypothetical protein